VLVANDTELLTFSGWTLRQRRPSQEPARLLLLLHGWSGDENSMWVFARDLSPRYWMLAPRAPYAATPAGFSWRPPHASTFGRPSLEMLRPSAQALIALVDGFAAAHGVDATTFDAIGFSQGAALLALLTLLYPQRLRKAAILAGFLPAGAEELIHSAPLRGKQIFVAHGTQDEMVPIERARQSISLLEQGGAEVIFCEDAVGHKVSAACLRAMQSYLQD